MAAYNLQPSEADVEAFLSLVPGLDRREVIERLKGNNNNVEQALGEYFDDSSSGANKYRWNEDQFSSDRDGVPDNHGISFNIHSPDEPGPYGRTFDGAPSRPPSRTSNNKSPIRQIIDMTAEHAAADPSQSLSHDEMADRELEQALEASRREAGMAPQESGITGTDEIHFGPATRTQYEYEQGQWGMVTLGKSSAQEIMLDPEPAERRRDLDVPAFLKPSIQNHRLNALITIFHEIPLTRLLFLNTIDVLSNYGYDKDWWCGKAIEMPTSSEEEPFDQDVDRELQRLMAFLDKTDRSYGSVDVLANLHDVKKAQNRYSYVDAAVLHAWRNLFEDNNQGMTRKLFSKGVPCEDQEDQVTDFAILELSLPSTDSLQDTLYDIADEVLWPELGPTELSASPYLSHIADVITFRVDGPDSAKNVDIPAVWYPDRYMKAARQAALDMRLKKRDVIEDLRRVYITEDQLLRWPMRGSRMVKVQDLFKASLRHDEAEVEDDLVRGDSPDVDMLFSQRPSEAALKLSAELRKVMANIDKKLIALNEAKDKAREELRNLSKLYTEPSDDPNQPKLHKYSLRGVSTTKNTMYICRRAEPDLIDMDLGSDEPKTNGDQWWRIHYAPIGSSPVTVEKTTEAKVLEATKTESKNILLVYASDYAMDRQAAPLPKPLETFVRFDNAAFKAEFQDVIPEDSPVDNWDSQASSETPNFVDDSPVGVSSPGKRKFYDQSEQDSSRYLRIVNVSERELGNTDESSNWDDNTTAIQTEERSGLNGQLGHEIIVGMDPAIVTESESPGQEMQERGGIPMLAGRSQNGSPTKTVDSMDLDQVIEDEQVTEESPAVKRVGFA